MRSPFLFMLRTYLVSVLVCVGLLFLLDDVPGVTWAVLFPMVTLASVLVSDWLEKNIEITVRIGKRK